jgi:molecular chaperone IbpA
MQRATVGFDRMMDHLQRTVSHNVSTYPPHDIVKHSDNQYTIEVAVAGFKESELEVTVEENILTIKGVKSTNTDREYVYKGISSKSFSKVIPLAEHVVVKSAAYQDGLLIVTVEIEIPEQLKPRKIEIASLAKAIAE